MRRWLAVLGVLVLSGTPVYGQGVARLASQTASGNLTTNGDVMNLTIPVGVGFGSLGVEAAGTWTGTIEIQCAASTGGGAFVALTLAPRNSATVVTSFTANGQWSASIAGCQRVRAAATAAMTGTAQITLTGSFPPFYPASAVNGGGVVTSPQLLAPDGSATAPSYSFATDATKGWYSSASNVASLAIAGSERHQFGAAIYRMLNDSAQITMGAASDVSLSREAAGHLFQRNSTNAQRASWANTYTSSTNYEAFSIDWQTQANVAIVGTRTAATGTARRMFLASQATNATNAYAGINLLRGNNPDIQIGIFAADATPTSTTTPTWISMGVATSTATSGSVVPVAIQPTYNQSSGTAANTDLLIQRTETAIGSGAQYAIQTQRGSTNQFTVTAGSSGKGLQIGTAQAAVPTCSSNCGTSPSVVGSDSAMTVTMGASGVPASGWVVTFNGTWPAAPACHVQSALNTMVVGKMPIAVVTTTTTVTVTTNGTAPATSDKYHILCLGIQ